MNELTYSFIGSLRAWEKRYWHSAMSDVEFVDWRVADKDPNYQVGRTYYEYATVKEMWKELDTLRDWLIAADQAEI